MWFGHKYAAPNEDQIHISFGRETKKIKVLDSEPNQSLAKSPNAHYTAIYGKNDTNFFNSGMRIKGLRISDFGLRNADWRQANPAQLAKLA